MSLRRLAFARATLIAAGFLSGCFPPLISLAEAQEPAPKELGAWKLERLVLVGGGSYRGLVQVERDREIDFVEIIQPAGKPMYAVVRGVRKDEIARLERLPTSEHRELVDRFEQFRARAAIEAGRREQVQLSSHEMDGQKLLRYEGAWFRFEGLVDEETARRCIVRIEQAFRAFRTVVPPRRTAVEPLRVRVFGSFDAYRAELRRHELALDHPAFYSLRERMIFAGSELDTFSRELQAIRADHARQEQLWKQRDAEFTRTVPKLREQLTAAGFTKDEINSELRLRKARWNDQLQAQLDQLGERNRRNDDRFHEVSARMFAQLTHEALHAYLDQYVLDPAAPRPPRWLHEGLALLLESGRIEGESLRIDAPHPAMLAELQAELRRGKPLALAEFLEREHKPFSGVHSANPDSRRAYAVAWGLTYYLTFQRGLLTGDRLLQYAGGPQEAAAPQERFEQLVGQPLPAFETAWRQAMLQLKPAR